MVYEFNITIPAGTTKDEPEEVEAQLVPGIITLVEAEFPNGCHRLVHISIIEGAYQMFPRNPDGTLSADGRTIAFNPHQELKRGHHVLMIRGWSPLTSYQHRIGVRFNVQPEEVATPWKMANDLVAILKHMMGL